MKIMKKKIFRYVFLLVSINTFAQAQLAVVNVEKNVVEHNVAMISHAALKANGDDWYQKYVINNILTGHVENRRKISFYLEIDSCGIVHINTRSLTMPEIVEGLYKTKAYIEKKNLIFYAYNLGYRSLLTSEKIKSRENIFASIHRFGEFSDAFWSITNGWFPLEYGAPYNYKCYVEEEIASAREPLTYLEWLKMKINYYISCPIESSLDYGITNDVFCPDYNGSENID